MKKIVISGKRKTAIAKATIEEGNGKITINNKRISSLPKLQQLELDEPIILAKETLGNLNFNITIKVKGGGTSSQIEAARLAIAKAIIKYTENENLKMVYLSYDRNLLVADTRRKEACKPGDSKARAMRQTSYR
jgi:small subunit ribosomal protein S9